MTNSLICAALAEAGNATNDHWLTAHNDTIEARRLANRLSAATEFYETTRALATDVNDRHGAVDKLQRVRAEELERVDRFVDRILEGKNRVSAAYMRLVVPRFTSDWGDLFEEDKARALYKFAALVELSSPTQPGFADFVED